MLLLVNYPAYGEEIYSLLLSWYGAGVIIVNLVIPFIWKKMTLPIYLAGSILWGIGIVVLGFLHTFLFIFSVFLLLYWSTLSGLARVYLLQTLIPANKLGRAFSFNAVILYASNVISLILFGTLTSFVEINSIFIFCGSMMIFSSFFYLIRVGFSENAGRKSIEAFK